MPTLIILRDQALVYAQTPKVASTSLVAAMHQISGLKTSARNPRILARRSRNKNLQSEVGYARFFVTGEALVEKRRELSNYFWFCAKRNPVGRVVSAYHSKVHRYAMHADKWAFRRGSVSRFSEGWKAVDDSRYLAKHVGKHISFAQMLAGLKRHGVDFDGHFRKQNQILEMDCIKYDMELRQEHLTGDLAKLCQLAGLDRELFQMPEKLNQSKLQSVVKVQPTLSDLRLIGELYREDFELLGYRMPETGG